MMLLNEALLIVALPCITNEPFYCRAMQRDALSEVVKRASSAQQQQDAIYAPNINLGSIPNATKSAFTPIDRRESKEFSK